MSSNEKRTVGDEQQVEKDSDQNVDKIREILFGGQMRDYQRRFDELESDINATTERMRQDLSKRIESLEGFVRRELELLGERLAGERHQRGEERKQLDSNLSETRTVLEDSLSRLDEQTAHESRNIRAVLQQKTAELADLIQHSRDDLGATLTRQANSLEDRKVGREDLAALLSEVALRLNRELDLPSD